MIYDALTGLDVDLRDVRVPGYRGRTIHPRGVLEHHTASPAGSGDLPSLSTCIHGRRDVPGPLCQILIGRAGTVAVVTDGLANHSGAGNWPGITSGNDQLIGVEIENNGVGEPWSLGLLVVAAKVTARLCEAFSLGIVIGHKEWAPGRKIDPSFDMDKFRNAVTGIRSTPPLAPEIIMAAPKGSLDVRVDNGDGRIRVTGWAYDPDDPARSILVAFHVFDAGHGPQITHLEANLPRPDVNATFGVAGDHGFDGVIDVPKVGREPTVIFYGLDSQGGDNPELGRGTVRVMR